MVGILFIARIQSFLNEKNSSSKYLIRVVETIGAQAAAKKYQVRCFMLTIFSGISCWCQFGIFKVKVNQVRNTCVLHIIFIVHTQSSLK